MAMEEASELAKRVGQIAETLKLSVIDCERVETEPMPGATLFRVWSTRHGYYEQWATNEMILKVRDLSLIWIPMIRSANRVSP